MTNAQNRYRFTTQNTMDWVSEESDNAELINCLNAFADIFDEMNDLVQNVADDVIDRIIKECASDFQTDESTESTEETFSNPPIALSISPDGIPMAMPIDCFFEVYDWFGESEVVEPVPGIPGVYMTYDRNKLITNEEHEWLPDAVVAYRVDDQDNIVSLSGEDMYKICNNMKLLARVIINSTTNERKVVFALK